MVFKDLILRSIKEYNVVGLIDKLIIDLEDYYKNKFFSIVDGSYDGVYRYRFMGKGKDGSIGFKVLDIKDLDVIFFIVENFGNNVFKVGSFLGSERLVVFFFFSCYSNKLL